MRADKNIVRGAVASLVTGILVTYSAVASTVTNAWFNEPTIPINEELWSSMTNSAAAPWSAVASTNESGVILVDAAENEKLVFAPPSPTSGVQVIEARLNFKAAYDSVDVLATPSDAKAGAALVKAGESAYKVAYYTGSAWTVGDAEYSLTATDAEVKLRITITGAELIYELYNSGDWLTLGSVATENQVTTAEFLGSGMIVKFQADVTNEAAVVIGGQTFKTLEEALDYLDSEAGAEFTGTISIDKDCTSSAGARFSAGTTITVDSDKNWNIIAPNDGTTQLAKDGNNSVVEEGKTTSVSNGTFLIGGNLFDKDGGGASLKFANGTLQLTENLVIGGKRPALQTQIASSLQNAIIIGYASQPDAAKLLLGAGVTIDSTNGKIELKDDGEVHSVDQIALSNFTEIPAGYEIKETYDAGAETYKYFYSLVEIPTVTLSFTYENVTYTVTTNDAPVEVIDDSATVVSNVAFTVEATPVSGYSYKTAPEGWTLTSGKITKSFTASDDPTAVSIPAPEADTPSPEPEAVWFDGKIGTGWPTADGMKGEWCADATTLATLNTDYIEVDTGSELLKFTPDAKGAVDEGVATITNSIKFSSMDMKSLAMVLDDIDAPKGGLTLVNNGGSKSFYGLAKDPNGATNMWTKLTALDSVVTEEDYLEVKLELTLKDGVTKIQYTVGGAASGWLEIVVAANKINGVSYRGYGEVKNLAGAYAQGAALLDGRSICGSFDEAYLTATNGATIKLLKDAVMGAGLGLKSVKIDANGKTLDISAAKASYNANGYECTYEDGQLVVKIPFAGKGTEAQPWQIANTNLLVLMKNGVNAGSYGTNGEYFVQTANLDLIGCGAWNAIGQENGPYFKGTYDGGNFTVDNLTLTRARYMALFGGVTDATIKNLTVRFAGIAATGADQYGASAVIGVSKQNLVITDVKAQGVTAETEVFCTHNAAGLVGMIGGGATFTRCVNELKIRCNYSKAGGICNFITGTGVGSYVFDSCTNYAAIRAVGTYVDGKTLNTGYVGMGGILGYDQSAADCTISFINCANLGAITQVDMDESKDIGPIGSILGHNNKCVSFVNCSGNTAQAEYLSVGVFKPAAMKAPGINGLNFATVAGNVATFVADSALAADGSYKVMTPLTTKAVTLAADKSIVFDCSLNMAFEAAITAPAGYHAEVTTNENVKTYTVVADKSILRFENLADAHIASVKVEQPVGTELTETAPGVYTLVSNAEYAVTYTAAGGYVFEGGATTKTVTGTAGKAEIVINPQSGDIPAAGQIFTVAFTPNGFSDYVVTTGEQVEVELTNNKIDFLENTAFTVTATPKTGFEYATLPEGWQSAAEGAITSNGTVTAAATIVIPLPTEIKVAGWFDGKINFQWPTASGMNGAWCENATSLATFETDHLKLSTKSGSLAFDPTESGNLKENLVTIESEIKFSAMEAADLPYGTEIDDLKSGIALVDNGDTTYNFYGVIRSGYDTTNQWVDLEITGTPDTYVAVTNVFKYSNKSATVKYIVNGNASSEYGMNAGAFTVTEVAYRGSGEVKTLTGAKEAAGEAMYGDEPYATFGDAFNAATNNATIKLLQNVAWDGAGAVGYKTVFIDLNGKLLDVSAATTAYAAKGLKCTYKDGQLVVSVPFTGEGTADAPWQIASYDDIVLFKNGVNAGSYGTNGEYFVQTADIDFAGKEAWEGIGTYKKDKPAESFGFAANYDGGNFKISNLKFTNREYAGLFNQIGNLTADGTVKNLVIENVSFADPTATTSFGGAFLAGHLHRGLIENVTTKGSLGSEQYPLTHNAVGIVCRMNAGSVVSCTNEAAIYSKYSKAAGIVNIVQNESNGGYTGDSVISGCVNSGAISQSVKKGDGVGGIAGYVTTPNYVEISGCVNSGVISSTVEGANIGQIAGYIKAVNAITSKVANVVLDSQLSIGNFSAIGFNYGVVDGEMATLGKATLNATNRVMTKNTTPSLTHKLAKDEWIAYDTELYTDFSMDGKVFVDDTENCKIESVTEGTVTTYTCVEIEWATLTVEKDAGVKSVTLTNTTYGVEVTAPYKADIDSNVVVSVNYELKSGYSITNGCVVPTSVTLDKDYLIAITTQVDSVSIESKVQTVDNADVKVECISPDGSETNDVTSTKLIVSGWTARIVYTAKAGYQLSGQTEFTFENVTSADQISYTKPTAQNQYKLIYEPGDEATGVWATNNLVYGQEHTVIELPEDFEKTGALFECWTNEVDGGEAYLPGAVVSNLTADANGEVYFTAAWTSSWCKVAIPTATDANYAYVVSNATEGVILAPMETIMVGGNYYDVKYGTKVVVYCKALTGYEYTGESTYTIESVTNNPTSVAATDLPEPTLKDVVFTVPVGAKVTAEVSNETAKAILTPTEGQYTAKYFSDIRVRYTAAEGYTLDGDTEQFSEATNGMSFVEATASANNYQLIYVAGTGATGKPVTNDCVYDVEYTVAEMPADFAKAGYGFQCWTNKETGAFYQPGDTVSNLTTVANGEVYFTASWTGSWHIVTMPATTVGYTYVVSNETRSAVVEPEEAFGNTYAVLNGDVITIYYTAAEGYVIDKTSKSLGAVTADTEVTGSDLPEAKKCCHITVEVTTGFGTTYVVTNNEVEVFFANNQTNMLQGETFELTATANRDTGWVFKPTNGWDYVNYSLVTNVTVGTEDITITIPAAFLRDVEFEVPVGEGVLVAVTNMATQVQLFTNEFGKYVAPWGKSVSANYSAMPGWTPVKKYYDREIKDDVEFPLVTTTAIGYTINYKTAHGAQFTDWAEEYTAPTTFYVTNNVTLPTAANVTHTNFIFEAWTNAAGVVTETAGLLENLTVAAKGTYLWSVKVPTADGYTCTVWTNGAPLAAGEKVLDGEIVTFKFAANEGYLLEGSTEVDVVATANDTTVAEDKLPKTFKIVTYTFTGDAEKGYFTVMTNNLTEIVLDNEGKATLIEATTLIVTATPSNGYEYASAPAGWTKIDDSVSSNGTVKATDETIAIPAPALKTVTFTVPVGSNVTVLVTNLTYGGEAMTTNKYGKYSAKYFSNIKASYTAAAGYELVGGDDQIREATNGVEFVEVTATAIDYTIEYYNGDGTEFAAWKSDYTAPTQFAVTNVVTLPTKANIDESVFAFGGWTNSAGQTVSGTTAGKYENLVLYAKITDKHTITVPVSDGYTVVVSNYTDGVVIPEESEGVYKVVSGKKVKLYYTAKSGWQIEDRSVVDLGAVTDDIEVSGEQLPDARKIFDIFIDPTLCDRLNYSVSNETKQLKVITGKAGHYECTSNHVITVTFTKKPPYTEGYVIIGENPVVFTLEKDTTVPVPHCVEVPDYLNFTAVDGDVTIGMQYEGETAETITSLEYAFDKNDGPWMLFEMNNAFATNVLVKAGKTVYFRRHAFEATNSLTTACGDEYDCPKFTMSTNTFGATVKAGGNVMSLLDKTCQATEVGFSAFEYLFSGCAALTDAPKLTATKLGNNCYHAMFGGCSSLTNAPVLAAEELAEHCYGEMFNSCTALTVAPELPAKTIVTGCYSSMFYNCSKLDTIRIAATNLVEDACFYWLSGVAEQGTFYCPPEFVAAIGDTRSASTIPTNWIVNPVTVTMQKVSFTTYAFTNLTENGEVKELGNYQYLVSSNATVEVTYTAIEGYKLFGTNPVIENNVVTNTLLSKPWTAKLYSITYLTEDGIEFSEWAEGYTPTNEFTTAQNVTLPTGENIAQTNLLFFAWTNAEGQVVTTTQGLTTNLTVAANMIKLWSVKLPEVDYATCTASTNTGDNVWVPLGEDEKVFNQAEVKFVFTAIPGYELRGTTEFKVTATANEVTVEEEKLPASLKQYYVTIGEFDTDSMTYVVTNMTVGGAELAPTGAATMVYKVLSNDNVKVAFTAKTGYTIFGAAETNIVEIAADATVTPPQCTSTPDYLSFTAVGGEVKISMGQFEVEADTQSFEYAFDAEKGPWTLFEVGYSFASNVVVAAGKTVYFRRHALDVTNSLMSGENFVRFTMTTNAPGITVKAGGNVMSLLDQTCQSLEVGWDAFWKLFAGCGVLTDAPELPATTLGTECYSFMFAGCTALTNAPVLPATELVNACYKYMFSSCFKLDTVRIAATNYNSQAFEGWLCNVASQGTIYCPPEFVAAIEGADRGMSTIPQDWIVNPVTVTVKSVNHATYAFTNVTANGEVKLLGKNKYLVSSNANIEVTYTAEGEYKLYGTNPVTTNVVADTVLTAAPTTEDVRTITYLTEDGVTFTEWAEGYEVTNKFTKTDVVTLPTAENIAQTNLLFFAWTNKSGTVTSTQGLSANLTVAAKMIKLWSVKKPEVANATCTVYTNAGASGWVKLDEGKKVLNGATVKFVFTAESGFVLEGTTEFTTTAKANDVTVETGTLVARKLVDYTFDYTNAVITVATNSTEVTLVEDAATLVESHSLKITLTPNEGYAFGEIAGWSADGASISSNGVVLAENQTLKLPRPSLTNMFFTVPVGEHVTAVVTNLTQGGAVLATNEFGKYEATYFDFVKASYIADAGYSLVNGDDQVNQLTNGVAFTKVTVTEADYTITYKLGEGEFNEWKVGYTAPTAFAVTNVVDIPTVANVVQTNYAFYGWTTNGADFVATTTEGIYENLTLTAKATKLWKITAAEIDNATCVITTNDTPAVKGEGGVYRALQGDTVKVIYTADAGYKFANGATVITNTFPATAADIEVKVEDMFPSLKYFTITLQGGGEYDNMTTTVTTNGNPAVAASAGVYEVFSNDTFTVDYEADEGWELVGGINPNEFTVTNDATIATADIPVAWKLFKITMPQIVTGLKYTVTNEFLGTIVVTNGPIAAGKEIYTVRSNSYTRIIFERMSGYKWGDGSEDAEKFLEIPEISADREVLSSEVPSVGESKTLKIAVVENMSVVVTNGNVEISSTETKDGYYWYSVDTGKTYDLYFVPADDYQLVGGVNPKTVNITDDTVVEANEQPEPKAVVAEYKIADGETVRTWNAADAVAKFEEYKTEKVEVKFLKASEAITTLPAGFAYEWSSETATIVATPGEDGEVPTVEITAEGLVVKANVEAEKNYVITGDVTFDTGITIKSGNRAGSVQVTGDVTFNGDNMVGSENSAAGVTVEVGGKLAFDGLIMILPGSAIFAKDSSHAGSMDTAQEYEIAVSGPDADGFWAYEPRYIGQVYFTDANGNVISVSGNSLEDIQLYIEKQSRLDPDYEATLICNEETTLTTTTGGSYTFPAGTELNFDGSDWFIYAEDDAVTIINNVDVEPEKYITLEGGDTEFNGTINIKIGNDPDVPTVVDLTGTEVGITGYIHVGVGTGNGWAQLWLGDEVEIEEVDSITLYKNAVVVSYSQIDSVCICSAVAGMKVIEEYDQYADMYYYTLAEDTAEVVSVGEVIEIQAESKTEAEKKAATLIVTSSEDEVNEFLYQSGKVEEYRDLFKFKVTAKTGGANVWNAEAKLTEATSNEIAVAVNDASQAIINNVSSWKSGEIEIQTKPGIWYGVRAAASAEELGSATINWKLGNGEKMKLNWTPISGKADSALFSVEAETTKPGVLEMRKIDAVVIYL